MSKEKQIEEMTKVIQSQIYINNDPCIYDCAKCGKCRSYKIAEALYNAGYRKQSEGEWISVEDRLPESTQMVLCYTPCDGYIFVGYYQEVEQNPYFKSYWNIITAMRSTKKVTKKVTHWKPLPEPPKMKGE